MPAEKRMKKAPAKRKRFQNRKLQMLLKKTVAKKTTAPKMTSTAATENVTIRAVPHRDFNSA